MSTPKRIQRKRTKGWRMPECAIYVGRPTRWGNPFPVTAEISRTLSLELFGDLINGFFSPVKLSHLSDEEFQRINAAKDKWLRGGRSVRWEARTFLRGKDLACYCPVDQPCHADVLLALANS